ncbi:hypothetical protein E2C01_096652 [Portunus trituberculatus]|uniref:Uncharacterized protein n=1 Tax=Portunus trituberculatus TaxID=210409 RepID=A0A5B7K3M3_PORTR|nr:hypothetical protein [Portunus trituberculatus]
MAHTVASAEAASLSRKLKPHRYRGH